MHPALTYALLALAALVFLGSFWIDTRPASSRFARLRRWTLVLQIGAIVAAYVVVRPGRGDDAAVAIAGASAEGRPILLDFYSNY